MRNIRSLTSGASRYSYMTMQDQRLAEKERRKYQTVWADPRYRKYSPGERLLDEAITKTGMRPGESVIDYGVGCGRAAQILQDKGYSVTGIDHVTSCLDEGIQLDRFIQACLWDLPLIMSDWAYCTDVMEHIPEEKVLDVLQGIRARTEKGAFFAIHLGRDGFGPQIVGEPLHLTIKPADWWKRLLEEQWGAVQVEATRGNMMAVCRV